MGKLKEKRWPFIVLSILLAFILWFYVRAQGNTDGSKSFSSVPIVFSGEENLQSRGLMVSSDTEKTVRVRVQGQWTTMNQVTKETVYATVDLSRITAAGEYKLPVEISFSDSIISAGLTVTERLPSQITVTVSEFAEKDIPVQAAFDGSVADGFQTGKIVISPETLHISGIAAVVDQVDHAQVTVTGENLSKTVTGEYPFELVDAAGNAVDQDLTCNTETIFVTMPVVTGKDVPLTLELLPGGGATKDNVTCTINPSVISVAGEPDDIADVTSISLGSLDLSKVTGNQSFTYNIVLPSGLTNVSEVTTATVTVEISGLATSEVSTNQIELINVPSGFRAKAVTQTKDILVRGTESAVAKVDGSRIRIVVDLSNAPSASGRYTLDAEVTLEGIADAGAVGDYTVVVALTRE